MPSPTVSMAVRGEYPDLSISRLDNGVMLRLGNVEFLMGTEKARQVAQLILGLADRIDSNPRKSSDRPQEPLGTPSVGVS